MLLIREIRGKELLLGFFLLLRVLPAEALYATRRVYEFLLASVERMAIRADFHMDIALMGGAGEEAVAARTHDAHFVVSGMNGCFHWICDLDSNH
jgi:hypothetical protein